MKKLLENSDEYRANANGMELQRQANKEMEKDYIRTMKTVLAMEKEISEQNSVIDLIRTENKMLLNILKEHENRIKLLEKNIIVIVDD